MLGGQLLFLSQNENALNVQSMMLQARKIEEQGWASECGSDEQSTYCSSLFSMREMSLWASLQLLVYILFLLVYQSFLSGSGD